MFKKLLLPVDLTDRHARVLQVAAELAAPSGGEVTLLHVVETIAGLSMEEEGGFYARLERAARSHCDHLGKDLAERMIPWRAVVRLGNRAQECVRYALE